MVSFELKLDSVVDATCDNNGGIYVSVKESYVVEGAGTLGVNGIYHEVTPTNRGNSTDDSPIYFNGNFFIYYHSGGCWFIDDNLLASNWDELYYFDNTLSSDLQDVVWSNTIPVRPDELEKKDGDLKSVQLTSRQLFVKTLSLIPASLGIEPIPVGHILSHEFLVEGAGTTDVNGIYNAVILNDSGDGEGKQIYSNGTFFIYYHQGPNCWVIDSDLQADSWGELYYYDENFSEDLASVSWSNREEDLKAQATIGLKSAGKVPIRLKQLKASSKGGTFLKVNESELLGIDPVPTSYYSELEYNWTGPNDFVSGNQDLTNLEGGEYSLVVRYEGEIVAELGPILVGANEGLSITLDNITMAQCPASSDGQIEVTVTGGEAPYQYSWISAGQGQNFTGDYAPENWEINLNGGDGTVEILASSLLIRGYDESEEEFVYTDAMIEVAESGLISFDWEWTTDDEGPEYDPAFYYNGSWLNLTDENGANTQGGHVEFEAQKGDRIGFRIDATDGCCGRGYLLVSDFAYQNTGEISKEEDLQAGEGEYQLIVTDANGCSVASEIYSITGEDIEKPVAICKDATVYLNEEGKVSIMSYDIDNGSYDNCGMRLPLVDKKHFTCEDLGENTVTLTVNDFYGNYDFCAATVTVLDTISPAIETLDDMVVWAEVDACSAVVEFSTPLASDACGVEVVQTSGLASGSEFPAGTTEVVFTAADNSGNTSESRFMVTVETVNKAPEFTAIAAQEVPSYAGMLSIPLSGITFGADCQEQEVVSVTATSEDTDLLSSVEVDYTAGESNGMLHLYYTAGVRGSTLVTVTVQDDGGTANGGTDVFEQSFELTITANQLPELMGEVDTIYVDKNTTYTADLPTGLFVDADPGDALSYSLTTKDGSALPAWVVLSPEQMQVTVSPTDLEVGEHTFLLTASDQLGATADVELVIVVQIPTGVEDLNQAFDFVVYPNPSKGKVYVRLQGADISEGEILIHTIGGQEIYRESYLFDKEIELDLSKEVDGVYFISIQSGGRVLTKKVILKK